MNQRARWALDEDELKRQQLRAEYFGLDKTKDFEDFKQKYLKASEDSGIITAVALEDIALADKENQISDDCKKTIIDVIETQSAKGGFSFDSIRLINIPKNTKGGTEILRTNATPLGNYCNVALEINTAAFSGKSKAEIDNIFIGAKNTVCNSLEDAVIHEIGHAKIIYGRTFGNYERIDEELKSVHNTGISKLAETDGLECIAECEVLLNRGETLSDELLSFYKTFTEGRE